MNPGWQVLVTARDGARRPSGSRPGNSSTTGGRRRDRPGNDRIRPSQRRPDVLSKGVPTGGSDVTVSHACPETSAARWRPVGDLRPRVRFRPWERPAACRRPADVCRDREAIPFNNCAELTLRRLALSQSSTVRYAGAAFRRACRLAVLLDFINVACSTTVRVSAASDHRRVELLNDI